MGNLPAGTLGLGRNDEEQNFNHRAGSLGRPPHDVLLPPPRLPAPANPISNGINRFKKGIKRIVGRVSSQMHQMYSIAGVSIYHIQVLLIFYKSIDNMAIYCFRTIEDPRTNDKVRSDQKEQST